MRRRRRWPPCAPDGSTWSRPASGDLRTTASCSWSAAARSTTGSRASPRSGGGARSERGPCATLRGMRVAVLSDIHANLPALDAVLAEVPSVDGIWQLGDVVGYGPHPDEVVARLRDIGAVGVRGNHDAAALGGREIESFNVDARRAAEW